MNRILQMRRRVECGHYDDPELIHAKLNGAKRKDFLARLGIDDPDVVHPAARSPAGATIALSLICGGGLIGAGAVWLVVWALTWLRGA